ncbi:protein of unknown function [Pseudomonas sp. JV551A1]|nr:protein of unknown function [Pseudomonas sp. JV551A1]
MTQHAVARLTQLDEHRPLRVQAGSEEIILIRQGDQVHGYQGNCPHEGAPLNEGVVCGGLLVCPWHKAAFAVDEGAVCEPPAWPICVAIEPGSRVTRYGSTTNPCPEPSRPATVMPVASWWSAPVPQAVPQSPPCWPMALPAAWSGSIRSASQPTIVLHSASS